MSRNNLTVKVGDFLFVVAPSRDFIGKAINVGPGMGNENSQIVTVLDVADGKCSSVSNAYCHILTEQMADELEESDIGAIQVKYQKIREMMKVGVWLL